MKIMFLTSEGFDTPNSINHLCTTLVEDILKSGIEVYSISSHKTGQYNDIPKALIAFDSFTYDIIIRKKINKNNFIIRYVDEIKYAFQAKQLWKKHKNDIDAVLLQSNPNSIVNAILLSIFLKKPIILNLYDVFPGHAMAIGIIKYKLIFNVLRITQRFLYKKCKYIVAMSEDMKAQLITEKVEESKIKVINSWFDNSVFVPIPREENKFFKKYNLDINKYYIQFAGLLGYVFDYKIFLNVAEKLAHRDDIIFLLIGDGNQKTIILEKIREKQLYNLQYYPWQPLEIISDVYNACDIGFIPLKPGVIGNGIPSKACQLMAAGKVILNSVEKSDYTDLFQDNQIGINVVDHNEDSIVRAIEHLLSHKEEMKKMGHKAQVYSYMHYSRDKNTAKFIELIRNVGI